MSVATTQESTVAPLDTTIELVTPERITFRYPLAGPFRRAVAYLIDLLVLLLLTLILGIIATLLSVITTAGFGLFLTSLFVLRFGYGAICEGLLFNGQTPGKMALKLRVATVEGVPITGAQAFLRNLLWCFDGAIPFAYVPALASMILSERFQRLGDLAAGTMVVVERRTPRSGLARVDDRDLSNLLSILPGKIEAGPELARALSDYVTQRARFSPDAREQLARPLADPARLRFDLPPTSSADSVVRALYHRVFLEDGS